MAIHRRCTSSAPRCNTRAP